MTYPTDPPQPTSEYPAPYQVPAVHTPKRKHPLRRHLLFITTPVALVMFGIGAATGAAGNSDPSLTAAPAPEVTITQQVAGPTVTTAAPAAVVKPTPTPKPKPVKATIADGDSVVVGSDVPAGRYDAHSDSTDCYYEIDKHATSDIINNGGFHTGHIVITLKRGQDFSSDSCGDWTQE